MGMDATAYLGFGVDCGLDCPYDDHDGEWCFDDFLADHAGLVNPYAEMPDEINYGTSEQVAAWKAARPDFDAQWDAWWTAKRKLEEEAPVEVVSYGATSVESSYMVVLSSTLVMAYWDNAKTFDIPNPVNVPEDTIRRAQEWCAERGIPFDNPQWLLAASYG